MYCWLTHFGKELQTSKKTSKSDVEHQGKSLTQVSSYRHGCGHSVPLTCGRTTHNNESCNNPFWGKCTIHNPFQQKVQIEKNKQKNKNLLVNLRFKQYKPQINTFRINIQRASTTKNSQNSHLPKFLS